jgi:hypothetical protein
MGGALEVIPGDVKIKNAETRFAMDRDPLTKSVYGSLKRGIQVAVENNCYGRSMPPLMLDVGQRENDEATCYFSFTI